MSDKTPVLLQHGWGFDRSMWEPWLQSGPDFDFLIPDRGYFGNPVEPDISYAKIAVSHSLGLHFLPDELFPKLNLLVIISGFQEFHPNTPIERTFSQRIVRHMLKNLIDDTNTVLKGFYKNCYFPAAPDSQINHQPETSLLNRDLEMLDRHKMNIETLRKAARIVIIHGMKDAIVPHNKAYQLQYSLPGSEIITAEDGGHMIPVTHREWCVNHIKGIMEQ